MKEKLYIDIDNTISQTIKYVICDGDFTNINIRPKYDEITNPDLFSIYGKNVEYVWPKVFSSSHTFIRPMLGAVNIINRLIDVYDVSFNTAREERFRNTTQEWLDYYGLNNIKLKFTPSGKKYADSDNDTIIIEDNIMELKNVNSMKYAILFNVPWSKTYAVDGNIKIVNSWKDIEGILL